jgi:urocanate hydratase
LIESIPPTEAYRNYQLPPDPAPSPALSLSLETQEYYLAIISRGNEESSPQEPNLGGELLYAGELDSQGRALVVAANIAGTASLSASADPNAQKQAIRDGIADFLVNSLDEALRILKNEVRKRNPVAVCVAAAPFVVENEMRERGVQPDLLRKSLVTQRDGPAASENRALVSWSVDSMPARWLPRLDAIALDCLKPEAGAIRRWIRLAPRYLGRTAQGVRVLFGDREFADRFVERVRQGVRSGEIGAEVQIQIDLNRTVTKHCIAPEAKPSNRT